jgi:hypothetical protein
MVRRRENRSHPASDATESKLTGNYPEVPGFLEQVIDLFAAAIPPGGREECVLNDRTPFPLEGDETEQLEFLREFVRQRLKRIAEFEYVSWMNGLMPFVSPRDIRIWRLRQFAEYIWDWDLPDDDDIATIFNLTKRQAGNLVGDFHARFRKVYLYPLFVRRLLKIVAGAWVHEARVGDGLGKVFQIPSKRYIYEMNVMISELRAREGRVLLRPAGPYRRNYQLMWVSDRVVELLTDEAIRTELLERHPVEGESQD